MARPSPKSLANLKRGNTVNVGRKPKTLTERAERLLADETGWEQLRSQWQAGTLPPPTLRTIAQMAGALIEKSELRMPDGFTLKIVLPDA